MINTTRHDNRFHSPLGVLRPAFLLSVILLAAPAQSATISLRPTRASGQEGVDWILGPEPNEITLLSVPQFVEMQAFLTNFGPDFAGAYQVTLDCDTHDGSVSGEAGFSSTDCLLGEGVFNLDFCRGVNEAESNYLLATASETLPASGDFECPDRGLGATFGSSISIFGDSGTDQGIDYYLAHFAVQIPSNGAGVFSIGIDPNPNRTFVKNIMAEDIFIDDLQDAAITIGAPGCCGLDVSDSCDERFDARNCLLDNGVFIPNGCTGDSNDNNTDDACDALTDSFWNVDQNGLWSNAANWDPAIVPNNLDANEQYVVTIDRTGNEVYDITLDVNVLVSLLTNREEINFISGITRLDSIGGIRNDGTIGIENNERWRAEIDMPVLGSGQILLRGTNAELSSDPEVLLDFEQTIDGFGQIGDTAGGSWVNRRMGLIVANNAEAGGAPDATLRLDGTWQNLGTIQVDDHLTVVTEPVFVLDSEADRRYCNIEMNGESIIKRPDNGPIDFEIRDNLSIDGIGNRIEASRLRLKGLVDTCEASGGPNTAGHTEPDLSLKIGASLDIVGDIVLGTDDAPNITVQFEPESTLAIGGNFLNASRCPLSMDFNWTEGNLTFDRELAGGVPRTHTFEVAGQDVGAIEDGFFNNFAMGTITIEPDQLVLFVDESDNQENGIFECEALYVDTLALFPGACISLQNTNIYYRNLVGDLNQPIEVGACCLPDGQITCVTCTAETCDTRGGAFQGQGVACAEISCDSLEVGVCCNDGKCSQQPAGDCNGEFLGTSISCEDDPCSFDIGICCGVDPETEEPTCDQVPFFACDGVFFDEEDSSCDVCFPPLDGACCRGNDEDGFVCSIETAASCSDGGDYQGGGIACEPNTCKSNIGACCLPDNEGCLDASESNCIRFGGLYLGNGTNCLGDETCAKQGIVAGAGCGTLQPVCTAGDACSLSLFVDSVEVSTTVSNSAVAGGNTFPGLARLVEIELQVDSASGTPVNVTAIWGDGTELNTTVTTQSIVLSHEYEQLDANYLIRLTADAGNGVDSSLTVIILQSEMRFSQLDGSIGDQDGVSNGTVVTGYARMRGNAALILDQQVNTLESASDLRMTENAEIRTPSFPWHESGPQFNANAGRSVLLNNQSRMSSYGNQVGGSINLCAAADIVLDDSAQIWANGATLGSTGGAVSLSAEGIIEMKSTNTVVLANGVHHGGDVTFTGCSNTEPAILVKGSINAIGWLDTGGDIDIQARQGGVVFNQGTQCASARGRFQAGAIMIRAATSITPRMPFTVPPAMLLPNSPLSAPCICTNAMAATKGKSYEPYGPRHFSIFATCMIEHTAIAQNPPDFCLDASDLSRDGTINLQDFALFQQGYQSENGKR